MTAIAVGETSPSPISCGSSSNFTTDAIPDFLSVTGDLEDTAMDTNVPL